MTDFLPSPLAAFSMWIGCGIVKTLIDMARKTPLSFYDIASNVVFGGIGLTHELMQRLVSVFSPEPKELETTAPRAREPASPQQIELALEAEVVVRETNLELDAAFQEGQLDERAARPAEATVAVR